MLNHIWFTAKNYLTKTIIPLQGNIQKTIHHMQLTLMARHELNTPGVYSRQHSSQRGKTTAYRSA
jgi:hypothetical protein